MPSIQALAESLTASTDCAGQAAHSPFPEENIFPILQVWFHEDFCLSTAHKLLSCNVCSESHHILRLLWECPICNACTRCQNHLNGKLNLEGG